MKIGLIDVDGHNFPNLAIMKLAGFHRREGAEVEWYDFTASYDVVYMAKVFTFTPDYPHPITNADKVVMGGTGYDLHKELPIPVEYSQPLYSIYPNFPQDTAVGFITRGCPNRCPWCVVPEKEGRIRPANYASEIIGDRPKAVFLDNNILAAGEFAARNLRDIAKLGTLVDFNQALDARLVDEHFAALLARCRWLKPIRFGCDTTAQISECERAIALLDAAGYKGQFMLYTIIGHDITEAVHRLSYWRGTHNGRVCVHAQPFIDFHGRSVVPKWQRDLARWANVRSVWKTTDIKDYEPRKGFKFKNYLR